MTPNGAAGLDEAAVAARVEAAVAAARAAAEAEAEEGMTDLLVCLGQEEHKVQVCVVGVRVRWGWERMRVIGDVWGRPSGWFAGQGSLVPGRKVG